MQENTPKTAAEWVFVARGVRQLPDAQDQALRFMYHAQSLAQDVADCLAVAKAWAEDFGNMEMARQCMSKAEDFSEVSDEWRWIADLWAEMGNYSQTIRIYRKYVEPRAWRYVDVGKLTYLRGSDGTTFITMNTYSELATPLLHDLVQEARRKTRSDYTEAIRLLLDAEAVAGDTSDWTSITTCWLHWFNQPEDANRCMTQAEAVAQNTTDWLTIEHCWTESFLYHYRTRYLSKAKSVAASFGDWMGIARHYQDWTAIAHDHEKRRIDDGLEECFYHAERLAQQGYEWLWLASVCDGLGWTTRSKAAEMRIPLDHYNSTYGFSVNSGQ